jgi:lysozyme
METVKKGSRGESVVKLQKALGLVADGIFGPATELKVKLFQKAKGLVADGVVGKNTWAALGLWAPVETKNISEQDIKDIINANKSKLTSSLNNKNDKKVIFDPSEHLIVVAIRGLKPELGSPNQNDRGIFDDGHFICTPKGVIMFEGNTDPSGFRKGYGTGSKKGVASLNTGVWFYGKGPHNTRPSFRQCAPVGVTRDGNPPYQDFGWFGINWHSASDTSTSSLGCQTNRPSDFNNLRDYIYEELDTFNNPKMCHDWAKNFDDSVRALPYILIDQQERLKGNLSV